MDEPSWTRPLDRQVADAFNRLDDDAKELYQERAAVRQYEGGLSRPQAERLALQDVLEWLRRQRPRQGS